jgi:hypothetical protein
MKKLNNYKNLFFLAFLLPAFTLSAQYKVKQVLIANGGVFFGPGNQITVGSYDPVKKKYALFDSVPGNNVNQVLVNGNVGFMATDSFLVSYDLDNLKRINLTVVNGLRHIAIYKEMIAASIGSDGMSSTHFKLFRQNDLSLVFSEKGIPVYCDGIAVAGDSAFIAMQGDYPNYNDTGKIAVVDLVNHKLARVITLDTAAKGIGAMFYNGTYIVGETDFPYQRLTYLNTKTGNIAEIPSVISSPFQMIADSVYGNLNGKIAEENMSSKSNKTYVTLQNYSYAAAELDTVNHMFYYTGPNYSKPAKAYIAAYSGIIIDSFPIGISPEGIAIDYRLKSGIDNTTDFASDVYLFPNPAHTSVYLQGIAGNESEISILDMAGKTRLVKKFDTITGTVKLSVENLPSGLYIINIKTAEGTITKKFVKN